MILPQGPLQGVSPHTQYLPSSAQGEAYAIEYGNEAGYTTTRPYFWALLEPTLPLHSDTSLTPGTGSHTGMETVALLGQWPLRSPGPADVDPSKDRRKAFQNRTPLFEPVDLGWVFKWVEVLVDE